MAEDWIKVRTELAEDQDVGQLSDILGTEDSKTIGLLVIFWSWADKQTTDGKGIKLSEERLDAKVGHQGFVSAMLRIGWLAGDAGNYQIPNFQRHNGNSAKARALEAEAKRLRRDAGKTSDKSSDKRPTKKPRNVGPEKRRVDINTPIVPKANSAEPAMPFDSDTFREAWATWKAYRTERGKRLTEITEIQQLKELKPLGEARSIAMIEFTISQGWIQLREQERDKGSSDGRRDPKIPRGESCHDIGQI